MLWITIVFICLKEQFGKSFNNTWHTDFLSPYLFPLASSNLLCSAEWKWRMIGLVSVQPQTTLSKLPYPQVCHLFIDDGYGGLTRIPKTTVRRNDFEGFLAGSSSPFPSTKPSWAFWPGLQTRHPLVLDSTWQTEALGWGFRFVLNPDVYSRGALLHHGQRRFVERYTINSVVFEEHFFHLIWILICFTVAQNSGQELKIWKLNTVLRWNDILPFQAS